MKIKKKKYIFFFLLMWQVLLFAKDPVELFISESGNQVSDYNTKLANITIGNTLKFPDGNEFIIDAILSEKNPGMTTVVYKVRKISNGVADSISYALRIPKNSGYAGGITKFVNLVDSTIEGYNGLRHIVKEYIPKLHSHSNKQYTLFDVIDSDFTLDELLNKNFFESKTIKEQAEKALIKLASDFSGLQEIGDFHSNQLVYNIKKKKWFLLDWTEYISTADYTSNETLNIFSNFKDKIPDNLWREILNATSENRSRKVMEFSNNILKKVNDFRIQNIEDFIRFLKYFHVDFYNHRKITKRMLDRITNTCKLNKDFIKDERVIKNLILLLNETDSIYELFNPIIKILKKIDTSRITQYTRVLLDIAKRNQISNSTICDLIIEFIKKKQLADSAILKEIDQIKLEQELNLITQSLEKKDQMILGKNEKKLIKLLDEINDLSLKVEILDNLQPKVKNVDPLINYIIKGSTENEDFDYLAYRILEIIKNSVSENEIYSKYKKLIDNSKMSTELLKRILRSLDHIQPNEQKGDILLYLMQNYNFDKNKNDLTSELLKNYSSPRVKKYISNNPEIIEHISANIHLYRNSRTKLVYPAYRLLFDELDISIDNAESKNIKKCLNNVANSIAVPTVKSNKSN